MRASFGPAVAHTAELLAAAAFGIVLSEIWRRYQARITLQPSPLALHTAVADEVTQPRPPSFQEAGRATVGPTLRERSRSLELRRSRSVNDRSDALHEHEVVSPPAVGRQRKFSVNQTPGAGDSDSDDERELSVLPRDVLSPVPADQATTIVVFGVDGNLATLKLLPTLFHLWCRRLLPRDTIVMGYARPRGEGGQFSGDADFRAHLRQLIGGAKHHAQDVQDFSLCCHFQPGQFGDLGATRAMFDRIAEEEHIREVARTLGPEAARSYRARRSGADDAGALPLPTAPGPGGSLEASATLPPQHVRMYYLSVPPFLYSQICAAIVEARTLDAQSSASRPSLAVATGSHGGDSAVNERGRQQQQRATASPLSSASTRHRGHAEERFVLEKPFGRDHATCVQLMGSIRAVGLTAQDTFYIDHYLGKELVMNLLVLRFANVCFGAIWNRQHIKSVQVIFKEKVGTEGRAGYFDQYGIMRDVMQNHLMQMVALVAMEQPLSFSAEHIRNEKLKVLHACRPLSADDVVTGQYAGYLDDDGIADKATITETFAAAVLHVHNPRWDGVPFVLKAGKALNDAKVELRVQFHAVPGVVSNLKDCVANELVVRVQPEECIYWKVQNKVPGLKFAVEQVRMDLLYAKSFMREHLPAAYERLLLEALVGDHSHFVSEQELEAQWQVFDRLLHELRERRVKPEAYAFGSRGPAGADTLARRHGMSKFGGGLTPYVTLGERIGGAAAAPTREER